MRICFIGDSFVNGTGDPHCLGWAGRICAQARQAGRDLTVYKLGIRRDTSRDIHARWRAEARARLPEGIDGRLVFSFGVNDCTEEDGRPRVAPEGSLAAAREMLREAASWRPTLMVGPPPIADAAINDRVQGLSRALSELCAELAVPFFDLFTPLADHAVWMREVEAGDGAHPGAAGYAAAADLVGGWPAWRRWSGG